VVTKSPGGLSRVLRIDPARCFLSYNRQMSDQRREKFSSWTEGYQAIIGLSRVVRSSGLEPALLELVKMRSSQINGCAYCIDMHSKDARAAGETEQRLYALSAWRELHSLQSESAARWP
jgi:AhpD family alkylhydroperoxidase